MLGKTNCATYCNSVSPLNKFITLNNNECRCYSLEPSIGDNVINLEGNECPDEYHLPNIVKMLSWLKPDGQLIMKSKILF